MSLVLRGFAVIPIELRLRRDLVGETSTAVGAGHDVVSVEDAHTFDRREALFEDPFTFSSGAVRTRTSQVSIDRHGIEVMQRFPRKIKRSDLAWSEPMSHARFVARTRLGLSLLEVSLGVSIVGSLLAVFIPTFVRSIHTSKTGEASVQLAEMHSRAASYFSQEHRDGPIARRWCLPSEAGPTPRHPSSSPQSFEFAADAVPGHETWKALGFQPGPIRYRYSFVPESTGCGIRRPENVVVANFIAEGDLDLDGDRSRFERAASIDATGQLVPEGALRVDDPIE